MRPAVSPLAGMALHHGTTDTTRYDFVIREHSDPGRLLRIELACLQPEYLTGHNADGLPRVAGEHQPQSPIPNDNFPYMADMLPVFALCHRQSPYPTFRGCRLSSVR